MGADTSARKQNIRFKPDCQSGPVVSFHRAKSGGLSILLQGNWTLLESGLALQNHQQPVALYYTPAEWSAFVAGVRDGEFDSYASGAATDLVPIRDSKDPDGPILIFWAGQIGPFLAAVRDGKYDLGPAVAA